MTLDAPLDPDLLPHRYDPGHDAVHYIRADRAARRQAPFLIDEHLPSHAAPLVLRREEAVSLAKADAAGRLGFVFHSAYCCSTLVANAYDRPGRSFGVKEPLIVNDLVGWRQRGGDPGRVGSVLGDALTLLARPFRAGETNIVKPSNVANGLAAAMIAARPEAGVLLLYAPLPVYLGSIASKGLWGRRWVRDLLMKQLIDNSVALGFERQDYFLQTDLQVAAVGWLSQHALFVTLAKRWPDRVRTLDSEALLAEPEAALTALDQLFGIASSDAERAQIVATTFRRNAKSGEAFARDERAAGQATAASLYQDEIDKVGEWAAAVAAHAGVAMTPPLPLLP